MDHGVCGIGWDRRDVVSGCVQQAFEPFQRRNGCWAATGGWIALSDCFKGKGGVPDVLDDCPFVCFGYTGTHDC